MKMTDAEKKNWAERIELHLLDHIEFEEEDGKWIWLDMADSQGHRIDYVQTDQVRYQSREACLNACMYQMRNSAKLSYAKTAATEAIKFLRRG